MADALPLADTVVMPLSTLSGGSVDEWYGMADVDEFVVRPTAQSY